MHYIGEIGVDAGMAGFFENKPDFDDEEWELFCEKLRDKDCAILPYGVVCRSGFGDGRYPVYGDFAEDGTFDTLSIEFIDPFEGTEEFDAMMKTGWEDAAAGKGLPVSETVK